LAVGANIIAVSGDLCRLAQYGQRDWLVQLSAVGWIE